MFGIDDMLLMAALGAGGGALFSKKDPLKGALIGGALGAGGAALPGLLGAGGATAGIAPGATAATGAADMLAAQEAGAGLLGTGNLGWGGATTGIQGGINSALGAETGATAGGLLGNADKIAKPVGTAVQAANMFTPPERPMPPPPHIVPPTASPSLSNLVQDTYQNQMKQRELEMQRRLAQKQRIAQMGRM